MPTKKEDLTLRDGDLVIYKGYSAHLVELIVDDDGTRYWFIRYENNELAIVKANLVKREQGYPTVFNPRHKDEFFQDEFEGKYRNFKSL